MTTIALVVTGYILAGILTAYVALIIAYRYDWDETNRQMSSILGGLFWPAYFPVVGLAVAAYIIYVKLDKLAQAKA